MLDLDRVVFFKAKFDVQAGQWVDALRFVVLSACNWALAKVQLECRRRLISLSCSSFWASSTPASLG